MMIDFKVLKPQPVPFNLDIDGQQVNLTLRPFNLSDEQFLRDNISKEEQIRSGEELDIMPWLPVIWHQMDNDSKKIIGGIKFIGVDDNGEELELSLAGHEKLARVLNAGNVLGLFDALLKCRGISLPDMEQARDHIKKNSLGQKK